ncbi:MAG: gliding motility-associated C-terminal domain-containing protein, partial [Cyclobacteriaceae bacterium]|nr:gliding motility-associated C-terminal domain-containing protein [Cyclobacteriaceae bacterium]
IRAFDGDPTDLLTLEAIGVGFDLSSVGIDFESQTGNSNIITNLQWTIDCDDVNLNRKDQYEIYVIAEDADKCKVPNADTIKLTLNILPPLNDAPEIFVNGDVLKDTVFVDAGNLLDMDITGIDINGDLISLTLLEEGIIDDYGIDFNPQSGIESVFSRFSWQTDCSLLAEDYLDGIYNFTLLLQDYKCIVPLSDTVEMVVVIRDKKIDYNVLPPNVYTPNADKINESYFVPNLPKNNCEQQFEGVVIYNRWGREVYSSNERDFHWFGEEYPTGVYFYLLRYTDFSVKGTISLLR